MSSSGLRYVVDAATGLRSGSRQKGDPVKLSIFGNGAGTDQTGNYVRNAATIPTIAFKISLTQPPETDADR